MLFEVLKESRGGAPLLIDYAVTGKSESSAGADKLRPNSAAPMLRKDLQTPKSLCNQYLDKTMIKQEPAPKKLLKKLTNEEESQAFAEQAQQAVKSAFSIQKSSRKPGQNFAPEKVSKVSDRVVASVPVVETNYQSPACNFRLARKNRRDTRYHGVWNHVPVLDKGEDINATPLLKRDTDAFSGELASLQADLLRSKFDAALTMPTSLPTKRDRLEAGSEAFQMAQRMNAPQLDGTVERMPFVSLSRRN